MIAIFDRQHWGKPGRSDLGAGYDLDADGVVELQEREAMLTPRYYEPAVALLEANGHTVHILDSGWYRERHAHANEIAAANPNEKVAFVACHINAGAGDYLVAIHDSRSGGGRRLASAVAHAAHLAELPGIKRCLVRPASRENNWKRGWFTIRNIWEGPTNISAICFEPYFLDTPEHSHLAERDHGVAIGEVLAHGLKAWEMGWSTWSPG